MRSVIHLLKFIVGLEEPASQVTERELEMLMHYSRGAAVTCELGCYEGRSSVAFLHSTQPGLCTRWILFSGGV